MAELTTTETDAGLMVQIVGVVDESFDLGDVYAQYHPAIVFDLSQVDRVTSYGVREWKRALDSVRADYLGFIRCSPPVVAQFNLVSNFGGRGELVSFFAPYRCPECEKDLRHLIDLRRDYSILQTLQLPEVHCADCNVAAAFDDLEEMYFDYASAAPAPRPPAAVQTLIEGNLVTRRKFRAEKAVRGDVTILRLQGPMERGAYFKRLIEGLQGDVVVVLSDVTSVSEDGLSGLERLLSEPSLSVYLAEVPTSLLDPVRRVLAGVGPVKAAVVSISVPLHCAKCQASYRTGIAGAALESFKAGEPLLCPRCATAVPISLTEPIRRNLTSIATATSPLDIAGLVTEPTAHPNQNLLLGKYRIERRIGRGGMGDVYLANQIGPAGFEKLVVLKRIRPDRLGVGDVVEGFLSEARIAAQLSHRNIVQIFACERLYDEYVIAMEHVVGIDLGEALRLSFAAKMTWPVAICCRIVSDLCAGLHAAHTHTDGEGRPTPVIHRDVSPSNVLLAADGTVKLTDFGIAKVVGDSKDTQSGIFKGKPAYAAPEQMFGPNAAGPRIDIYAAGAVLYECLSGSLYRPRTIAGRYTHAAKSLAKRRAELPEDLLTAVSRALSYRAVKRHESAQELRNDLEKILRRDPAGTDDLAAWVAELTSMRDKRQTPVPAIAITLESGQDKDHTQPTKEQTQATRAQQFLVRTSKE